MRAAVPVVSPSFTSLVCSEPTALSYRTGQLARVDRRHSVDRRRHLRVRVGQLLRGCSNRSDVDCAVSRHQCARLDSIGDVDQSRSGSRRKTLHRTGDVGNRAQIRTDPRQMSGQSIQRIGRGACRGIGLGPHDRNRRPDLVQVDVVETFDLLLYRRHLVRRRVQMAVGLVGAPTRPNRRTAVSTHRRQSVRGRSTDVWAGWSI